jgi:hypothetical protein
MRRSLAPLLIATLAFAPIAAADDSFALAAQLADGQPQDKAQATAATMAADARKSAETSFTNSVALLIDLRN